MKHLDKRVGPAEGGNELSDSYSHFCLKTKLFISFRNKAPASRQVDFIMYLNLRPLEDFRARWTS